MIGNLLVLALIPARGGSKGVPGKNILPVRGLPLIGWTIEAARKSSHVDRIVLSSDSEEIIDTARRLGCEAPFRRDASLASDEASSVDVVIDALQRVPGHDIVVLLQPTSPLRVAADIDGVLQRLVESGASSCVSVREAEDHPYWTFAQGPDGRLARFAEPPEGMPMRRQDLPKAWCLNGAVYAARVDWFMRHKTFLSSQTVAYPMPADRSLDIDTPADVEQFQRIAAQIRPESAHQP